MSHTPAPQRAQKIKESAVVKELLIFPIKGCRGISVQSAELTPSGFKYDRAWAIIDVKGIRNYKLEFISKRKLPCLATLTTSFSEDGKTLKISAPEGTMPNSIEVPTEESAYSNNSDILVSCSGKSTTAKNNDDWELLCISSKDAGQTASDWLTEYLNKKTVHETAKPPTTYKLVRCMQPRKMSDYPAIFPLIEKSKNIPDYISRFQVNETRFHDFAPLLLTNEASCAFLSERVTGTYPIHSFRANIVVKSKKAWDEETWKIFTIGAIKMQKIKECPRCTVPCRDEMTGKYLFKPLLTLWKILKKEFPKKFHDPEWGSWAGPYFGIYIGHGAKPGVLHVGDKIVVSEYTTWDAHLPKSSKKISKSRKEPSMLWLYIGLFIVAVAILLGYLYDKQ